jgi:exosortase A
MVSIVAPFRAVSVWRDPMVSLGVGLALLLALYHETLFSMVATWAHSDTFAHGFLIFPISFYLIWRRRAEFAHWTPAPDYRALVPLAATGLIWLLGRLAGVLVVEQATLVGMMVAWVCATLGFGIAWRLAFPLGFLLFAVPFGDFLITPLMNFTADFTVALIQLTGIPVYREGTFFSIPSGDWSVVTECSGIRYLIASITLGCLYAYLSYRSLTKRLVFIAVASVFPIIANGLRAYMIVMIGHLSGMKLAVGVDHLIYGWVFFGLVMLLMFWLGSFWSDAEDASSAQSSACSRGSGMGGARKGILVFLSMTILTVVWPLRAKQIETAVASTSTAVSLAVPEARTPWRRTEPLSDWEPHYSGADGKLAASYTDGTHSVAVYILYYHSQRQDHELINYQNVLIPQQHPVWRMPGETPVKIALAGRQHKAMQSQLKSARQNLLVWRWNRVFGTVTVNDYWAKMLEAGNLLLGEYEGSAAVVIATDWTDRPEAAALVLQGFVDGMWPSLERTLDQAEADRS